MTTVTVKTRNVNSKKLFNSINTSVIEVIDIFGLAYPMNGEVMVDILEEYLEEHRENGQITQYSVMCDERNNKLPSEEMNILIKYKQLNCLNITELEYHVRDDKTSSITAQDVIDYYLYGGGTP